MPRSTLAGTAQASQMRIARAGMEAVPEVHALICEAARWLSDRGEPLWGEEETSGEDLVGVARAGELVTGMIAGTVCACMYLHSDDRVFWPNAREAEALYLHRLAVARRYAGLGYARAMLEWAQREAQRMGRDYLRLDCEPRPKLLALYRNAGFTAVDSAPIQVGRHFVVRHQKPVSRR
jgi:GNAT superfamily N-acetyltransferase